MKIFLMLDAGDLNWLVQVGQMYSSFPFFKDSLEGENGVWWFCAKGALTLSQMTFSLTTLI